MIYCVSVRALLRMAIGTQSSQPGRGDDGIRLTGWGPATVCRRREWFQTRVDWLMNSVPKHRVWMFLLIAIGGLTCDLYSKSAVFSDLGYPQGQSRWVIGQTSPITFRFYTSMNEGALWGVGQGYAWLFAVLSLAAIAAILYWLFVRGAAVSAWLTVALALIMSGTLGNLYDRLGLHECVKPGTQHTWYAVRDFLLFTFWGWPWPVFNFADVFLVTGAIMLVLQSFGMPQPVLPAVADVRPAGSTGASDAQTGG
jgi:signal peptidase II